MITTILLWALYLTGLVLLAKLNLISFEHGITQAILALCGTLAIFSMARSIIFHLSTPYLPVKGMFGERYAIIADIAISAMGVLTYGLIRRAVCITEGAFHRDQLKAYKVAQKKRIRYFRAEIVFAFIVTFALAAYLRFTAQ